MIKKDGATKVYAMSPAMKQIGIQTATLSVHSNSTIGGQGMAQKNNRPAILQAS